LGVDGVVVLSTYEISDFLCQSIATTKDYWRGEGEATKQGISSSLRVGLKDSSIIGFLFIGDYSRETESCLKLGLIKLGLFEGIRNKEYCLHELSFSLLLPFLEIILFFVMSSTC
jgi:hypothetical protein